MNNNKNNLENSQNRIEISYWVNRTLIYDDAPPNDASPVEAFEAESEPYYLQDDDYEMMTVFDGQIDRLGRIRALKELTRRLEADEIDIDCL